MADSQRAHSVRPWNVHDQCAMTAYMYFFLSRQANIYESLLLQMDDNLQGKGNDIQSLNRTIGWQFK